MANTEKKKKMSKADKNMLAIRIMCGIMGGLMLVGVFAMIFQLL